jgi:hypothetical protein
MKSECWVEEKTMHPLLHRLYTNSVKADHQDTHSRTTAYTYCIIILLRLSWSFIFIPIYDIVGSISHDRLPCKLSRLPTCNKATEAHRKFPKEVLASLFMHSPIPNGSSFRLSASELLLIKSCCLVDKLLGRGSKTHICHGLVFFSAHFPEQVTIWVCCLFRCCTVVSILTCLLDWF